MTPKEKAKKLVDKMEGICSGWSDEVVTDDVQAKQCALIAVDQILNVLLLHHKIDYWKQVKKEIEKL